MLLCVLDKHKDVVALHGTPPEPGLPPAVVRWLPFQEKCWLDRRLGQHTCTTRLPSSATRAAAIFSSRTVRHQMRKRFQARKPRKAGRARSWANVAASANQRSSVVSSAAAPGRARVMPPALSVYTSAGSRSAYATTCTHPSTSLGHFNPPSDLAMHFDAAVSTCQTMHVHLHLPQLWMVMLCTDQASVSPVVHMD